MDNERQTERADKFNVTDLNLWYGKFQALKHISMNIREKEITAFIGPSGCGKSTFLKTLNRMNDLVPDCKITGQVLIDGEDLYGKLDINVLRKRVGMVFQKPNPFPMSVYDNIAYGPKTHGVRKKAVLDEIVERSLRQAAIWDELKDRLKKSALGLSGGQQQRSDERARSHFDEQDRRSGAGAQRKVHDRHGHAQHAAGGAHFRQNGVLSAGRSDRIRRYRSDL